MPVLSMRRSAKTIPRCVVAEREGDLITGNWLEPSEMLLEFAVNL
jgi:hypothetical protein